VAAHGAGGGHQINRHQIICPSLRFRIRSRHHPSSTQPWFIPLPALASDRLTLSVEDLEVDVLTGIYSEETHLPQPLRISIHAQLAPLAHYAADTPLTVSKNYMDLKHAATTAIPPGVHFKLIEAVADFIADTIFAQDDRVLSLTIKIIKLAIAEANESIGITLTRARPA
jgi:7,8-dihydroneopterin aldolase/epimerase/oxygenase